MLSCLRNKRLIGFIALALSVSQSVAFDGLPEPLTLDAALRTAANQSHHDIALLNERIRENQALLGVEDAEFGVSVDLKGRLRQVGVSEAGDADEDDDSAISLLVSKPLYDFGRSNAKLETLALRQQVLLLEKQQVIEQRRLLVMEKYFDVLNADNDFIAENENLAIGFIRYDRARENQLLGLSSDIEVLKLQSQYETIRQARYLAENNQRLSRMALAEAMGFPQHIPNSLQAPVIKTDRPLNADVDLLIDHALRLSPRAQTLAARSRVAESAIHQAENVDAPRLDLELELSSYARESSTRDDWRASVYFDVPLYSGHKSSSLALAQVRYRKTLTQVSRFRSELRLEVLRLWQSVQQNRLIAEGYQVEQNYRDLYLDRSRAEYDLEFKTDLGDAMAQFSRVRTERLKALYAYELAYTRLQSLIGNVGTTDVLKPEAP